MTYSVFHILISIVMVLIGFMVCDLSLESSPSWTPGVPKGRSGQTRKLQQELGGLLDLHTHHPISFTQHQ